MLDNSIFNRKTVFSFEVFPPKKTSSIESVYKTLDELSDLKPDFISVTYGAGGSENCSNTLEIAKRIKDSCHVESVVHLPCLHLSKKEASVMLKTFSDNGIENLLVLRGDRIEGREPAGDFKHASDLISFIKKESAENGFNFHLSGACYPENHPESKNVFEEIKNLKLKADCGADHLISQLFYDNHQFYRFIENCRIAEINAPIEAGIMPVTNKAQIERMVSRCGVALPEKYRTMLETFGENNDAIFEAGIAYAVNQIIDLVSHGVQGIHLYTMNRSEIARRIYENVKKVLDLKAA
ncbi:MAG: methylenetetrahydrofolate reductase [NAD(P)H] [Treponemataceae bacterium]|nr:methylenetetrahydrofolate reductase [NAD(P)H] [Treponemataceae bacterium]